jgi:hypothetical protein
MPSEAGVGLYNTSQGALPAPQLFHQDTERYKDQPILRKDRFTNMGMDDFYEQRPPNQDFTAQRHILPQHYTSFDDNRTITRLLETESRFYLPLVNAIEPLQHARAVERSLNLTHALSDIVDFITSSPIEHPIILEIYELSESDDEYKEKTVAKSKSVSYAVIFVKNMLKKCKTNPEVDLHPDGEVSLTWRSNRGIINIAFGEDGMATYAAYFLLHKETHKGRFSVSSVIPETIINIIDQIEKSNDQQC